MMEEKARIAVLGAGHIGLRHIEHVSREVNLVAIIDPSPKIEDVAREYSTAWYSNLTELLAADRPDGVIIATPNKLHVEHGLECISAGVSILVEKPIADDVAQAESLVTAAEKAKVPILVGHHRRHNPIVEKAKHIIAEGRLGDLVAVNATCWVHKPNSYFDTAWRHQPGGGPIYINLIHDIDLLRHLCGEIISIQAFESNASRGHKVEDTAVVIVRFANGAMGTLTVSDTIAAPWSWELTAAENAEYPPTGAGCYMIGGTKGSLSIPDMWLWTYSSEPNWFEPISREPVICEEGDPFAKQVRHFAEVALGRCKPLVSGREGLATLKVVAAVKKSAMTGQLVEFAEL